MVYLLVLALVIMVCVYKRMHRGGRGSGCGTIYVCGTKSECFYDIHLRKKQERVYGQSTGDAWSHDREVAKHGEKY